MVALIPGRCDRGRSADENGIVSFKGLKPGLSNPGVGRWNRAHLIRILEAV
jgi:hypothetical protein